MSVNIEQVVKKILQAENLSSPPIDAEQLAEFHFGLNFDCRPLADTNILAELSVAQKTIYINEARADDFSANVGLKNFTIAHELGHWVLHRHLLGEQSKQIEREADLFAVYLLMPEQMVRAEFAKLNSQRLIQCLSAEIKLSSMAQKFRVSRQAMSIRLSQRELKLMYLDKSGKVYRDKQEFLDVNATVKTCRSIQCTIAPK